MGTAYLQSPKANPAFERIDSWLMLAFAGMPKLELSAYCREKKPRMFELRTYESHSELKALKKVEMFKNVDDYIEGKKACPKDVGDQWAIHAAIISRITNDTKSYEDKCFAVFEERFVGMDTDIQASTMLSTLKTYLGRKKMSLPDLVMKIPANRKTVLTKVVSKYNYVAAGVMQTA